MTQSDDFSNLAVLITGATVGLGLEAARQLADHGWGRVLLGCRDAERAEAAKRDLTERTGRDAFEIVLVDVSDLSSATGAVDRLASSDTVLDAVILNAGIFGGLGVPARTADGMGEPFAASVAGNATLAVQLARRGRLSVDARLVYAGSESARGFLRMRTYPRDLRELADARGESLQQAIESFGRVEHLEAEWVVDPMLEYATNKLVAALWVSALARRFSANGGPLVLTVSPGNTSGTNVSRDMPLPVGMLARLMMFWAVPLGLAHSMKTGAARYIEAVEQPDRFEAGRFYGSPGVALTGSMVVQDQLAALDDVELQEAAWAALATLTGGLTGFDDAEPE